MRASYTGYCTVTVVSDESEEGVNLSVYIALLLLPLLSCSGLTRSIRGSALGYVKFTKLVKFQLSHKLIFRRWSGWLTTSKQFVNCTYRQYLNGEKVLVVLRIPFVCFPSSSLHQGYVYLRAYYAVQFQLCVHCRYTLIYGSSREPCTVLPMYYDDLVGSSSIRRQADLKSWSAKPWAIGNGGWPFYWSNRKAAPFFVGYKVRIHKNREFELVYQSLSEYILLTKVIRWKVRVPWMSNTQSLRWMN